METDAETIGVVSTEGQQTDQEMSEGQATIVELDSANAASLEETVSVQQQAIEERQQAQASEQDAQSTHDNLESRLQSWASEHTQARAQAVQVAVAQYSKQDYKASEV